MYGEGPTYGSHKKVHLPFQATGVCVCVCKWVDKTIQGSLIVGQIRIFFRLLRPK